MKKIILLMIIAVLTASTACSDDLKTTDVNKLPTKAQQYLKNFSSPVSLIEIDENLISDDTYEVILADGTEVEFNADGEWRSIDCQHMSVPTLFVPKSISDYVSNHFANLKIVKIKIERRGYDVELSNDIELKFDKNGNFVKIDD